MMAWMVLPLAGLAWLLALAWGWGRWNRLRQRRRRQDRLEGALLLRYKEQEQREHDAEERRGGRR